MDGLLLPIEAMRRRRGVKWGRHGGDVLPAWIADMDLGVPEPVQQAILRVVEGRDYGYPLRAGDDCLEAAFAHRMRERFGWEVDRELVLPVADLVQAIVASVVAFAGPGEGVVVQTPIYPPFLHAAANAGRRLVVAPLEDDGKRFGFDPERLAAVVDEGTRLVLVCNPHNPTGRVFSREELEAIGRLAVERDLVIVSDEVHCDLVYPGARHVPMATLGADVAARTVTLNSATKSFNIAGLRCAVLHLGSPALLERFRRAIPERLLGTVGVLGVDASVAGWREGQPWLDEVMGVLGANRDRVAAWAAGLAPAVRHHPPEATYLAWLDCAGVAEDPHRLFLEEARVALSAGADFGPGGETCVRLNFATSPHILDELLARMARVL